MVNLRGLVLILGWLLISSCQKSEPTHNPDCGTQCVQQNQTEPPPQDSNMTDDTDPLSGLPAPPQKPPPEPAVAPEDCTTSQLVEWSNMHKSTVEIRSEIAEYNRNHDREALKTRCESFRTACDHLSKVFGGNACWAAVYENGVIKKKLISEYDFQRTCTAVRSLLDSMDTRPQSAILDF